VGLDPSLSTAQDSWLGNVCVCVCVCVCDRKKEREVTFPGPPSSTLFWSQKRVTSLRCMLLAQPHLHHLI
jgi:hypothetical protein